MSRPVRTFVAAILLAALIVAGIAIAVPLIARPIVISTVQAASPFGDAPLDVDVDLNVFGLVTGTVDRIHVRGSDVQRGDVTIGALDVSATDVATSGRSFRDIAGTLASMSFPLDDGTSLAIDDVSLDGPSDAMAAVATLGHEAAAQLIVAAFADSGVEVSGVDLGAGTVAFEAFGARVEVPIGVEDGAIVVIDPFGTGSLEVIRPGEEDPWGFTGVAVTPGGLTIDAIVDAGRLLAQG
jgi:hypothetical protein